MQTGKDLYFLEHVNMFQISKQEEGTLGVQYIIHILLHDLKSWE
jgi:hypothetical protein